MTTIYTPLQYDIFNEIYKAFEDLGANSGLLSCISSLGDTMTDEQVLEMLQDWNKGKFVKTKAVIA